MTGNRRRNRIVPREADALPREVDALYGGVKRLLETACENGSMVGSCRYGVYLFRDYDGEPIYVGQTREKLSTRIRRHLTGQRSDAVAMSVLDPFEVDEIEMWPFWELDQGVLDGSVEKEEAKQFMDHAEYWVYGLAIKESQFGIVLNEKAIIRPKEMPEDFNLPDSVRGRVLSDDIREERGHPDVRLARRAQTMANLAAVIGRRSVSIGIRRTLLAQAQRLEGLARARVQELEDSATGQVDSFNASRRLFERCVESLRSSAAALSEQADSVDTAELADIVQTMQNLSEELSCLAQRLLENEG